MRRRLDLGSALIGRPRILFLDEPTTGLDPRSRLGMWDVIRGLVREGTTLLLTTQYLEEADELADTIAVVDHGKIIARGTADELKSQVGGERIEVVVRDRAAVPRAMELLSARRQGRGHARRAHPAADRAGQRRWRARPRPGRPRPRRGRDRHRRHRPPPADARRCVPGADRSRGGAVAPGATRTRRPRRRSHDGRPSLDPAAPAPIGSVRRAFNDGLVVAWRNLKRIPRIPELAIFAILQSIMFVLLFAFVFGGAIPLPGRPTRTLPRIPDARHLRPDHRLRRRRRRRSGCATTSTRGSSTASARCRWRARRC